MNPITIKKQIPRKRPISAATSNIIPHRPMTSKMPQIMTLGSTPINARAIASSASKNVPAFLNKLYNMVNDSSTNDLIHWSEDGTTFIVQRHEDFAKEVLPRFFKHNNFSSFVRQLNMYGFHKVPHLQQGVLHSDSETELWEFTNPHFQKNQPDLLCLVNRKKGRDTEDKETLSINNLITEIAAVKRHQYTISSDLKNIQRENQLLWNETMTVREMYQRQKETIDKIIRFLASFFTTKKNVQSPKRRRLLIEDSATSKKRNENENSLNSEMNDNINITSLPIITTPTLDIEEEQSPNINSFRKNSFGSGSGSGGNSSNPGIEIINEKDPNNGKNKNTQPVMDLIRQNTSKIQKYPILNLVPNSTNSTNINDIYSINNNGLNNMTNESFNGNTNTNMDVNSNLNDNNINLLPYMPDMSMLPNTDFQQISNLSNHINNMTNLNNASHSVDSLNNDILKLQSNLANLTSLLGIDPNNDIINNTDMDDLLNNYDNSQATNILTGTPEERERLLALIDSSMSTSSPIENLPDEINPTDLNPESIKNSLNSNNTYNTFINSIDTLSNPKVTLQSPSPSSLSLNQNLSKSINNGNNLTFNPSTTSASNSTTANSFANIYSTSNNNNSITTDKTNNTNTNNNINNNSNSNNNMNNNKNNSKNKNIKSHTVNKNSNNKSNNSSSSMNIIDNSSTSSIGTLSPSSSTSLISVANPLLSDASNSITTSVNSKTKSPLSLSTSLSTNTSTSINTNPIYTTTNSLLNTNINLATPPNASSSSSSSSVITTTTATTPMNNNSLTTTTTSVPVLPVTTTTTTKTDSLDPLIYNQMSSILNNNILGSQSPLTNIKIDPYISMNQIQNSNKLKDTISSQLNSSLINNNYLKQNDINDKIPSTESLSLTPLNGSNTTTTTTTTTNNIIPLSTLGYQNQLLLPSNTTNSYELNNNSKESFLNDLNVALSTNGIDLQSLIAANSANLNLNSINMTKNSTNILPNIAISQPQSTLLSDQNNKALISSSTPTPTPTTTSTTATATSTTTTTNTTDITTNPSNTNKGIYLQMPLISLSRILNNKELAKIKLPSTLTSSFPTTATSISATTTTSSDIINSKINNNNSDSTIKSAITTTPILTTTGTDNSIEKPHYIKQDLSDMVKPTSQQQQQPISILPATNLNSSINVNPNQILNPYLNYLPTQQMFNPLYNINNLNTINPNNILPTSNLSPSEMSSIQPNNLISNSKEAIKSSSDIASNISSIPISALNPNTINPISK